MLSPGVERFLEASMRLRVDAAIGPAKPYKPLMLAAVVLLIGKGKIVTPDVFLDGGLRSVCRQLLDRLYPSWPYRFDARYPFRHLESDGVWTLVPIEGRLDELRLARDLGVKARALLKNVLCARLDATVFEQLAASPGIRSLLLSGLAERYLVPGAGQLLAGFESGTVAVESRRDPSEILYERVLEESLQRHWSESAFGKLGVGLESGERSGPFGRQVLTGVSTIDLLGYRPSRREWWVIELKRGRPSDAVVGQTSRYLGWIERERAREGDRVVGAIVAHDADEKLRYAVSASEKLSLWVWNDFDVRLVS